MLKKRYRLKKHSAFTQTYKVKNIVSDDCVVIYRGRVKNSDDIPTKVGFVVTKKVHKKAVKRNRVKRLYREAYRIAFKNGEIEKAQKYLSIIFFIKQPALDLDYKSVYSSVVKLMNR